MAAARGGIARTLRHPPPSAPPRRTGAQAAVGNLVADVMRVATGAEVALINAGTLRAERAVAPGVFSMRELFELLPMMEARPTPVHCCWLTPLLRHWEAAHV